MKSIPSVESDSDEKDSKGDKGKTDDEEISFDNFGSWVNETRAKNRKK